MVRRRELRIVGRGDGTKLRLVGDWERAPLEALVESRRVAAALDKLQRQLVEQARVAGRSWTEIGNSLGITKQSAWERFSALPDESPRRTCDD
jgi:DNA-directed RNA polymerase specialized sigma24 family protein